MFGLSDTFKVKSDVVIDQCPPDSCTHHSAAEESRMSNNK